MDFSPKLQGVDSAGAEWIRFLWNRVYSARGAEWIFQS
jgi:hypothetical protein